MLYLSWIILVATGLAVGILVFLWALKDGQFSEQERARYLPLRDDFPMPAVKRPSKLSVEVYALLIVIWIGLAAMVSAVVLTLLKL
jgi:cbb3-type cytochrome oxidase maturation protein